MEVQIIFNKGKNNYTEPTKEEKKQFKENWS